MKTLKERLAKCSLYCFTPNKHISEKDIISIVQQQIKGGADIIQLREKRMPDRNKLELALKLRKITKEKRVLFIVNDDIDLAYFSNADGVHLGQNDIPIEYARKLLKDKLIGVSTHNLKQYKEAQIKKPDYIAVSPIFPTMTKPEEDSPLGIPGLTKILKNKKSITVALGGITYNNLDQFPGIAIDIFGIIRNILSSESILNQTKLIKEKINKLKSL